MEFIALRYSVIFVDFDMTLKTLESIEFADAPLHSSYCLVATKGLLKEFLENLALLDSSRCVWITDGFSIGSSLGIVSSSVLAVNRYPRFHLHHPAQEHLKVH